MTGSTSKNLTGSQLNALSKPLCPGGRIDYFMSHSWHDDAETKWVSLLRLVDQFKALQGRYPTFWFDKVFALTRMIWQCIAGI